MVVLVAIGLLVFLQYQYVLYLSYIMDEFVDSSLGGDMFLRVRPYVDYFPFKTQLGVLLYGLPYLFCRNMEAILLINRHTAFLFVILSLYLLFRLHRSVFDSMHGGLWAVFWTLACSTFIEHSATIRVDIMATCLALLAVYLMVILKPRVRALAAGICLGIAFCTTQKSIYFILPFMLSFWLLRRKAGFRAIREFALFAVGGLAVFAAYLVGFGHGGAYVSVLQDTFNPQRAVSLTVVREFYQDLPNFHWQTFSRNISFYCLSFLGLAYVLRLWRTSTWQQEFVACFTLGVVVLLLIHRHSWPYVFMFGIPFLGLFAAVLSDLVYEALRDTPRLLAVPALILLVGVGINTVQRYRIYSTAQALEQMPTVRAAEAILGPEDTYFDGVRMIGTRTPASWLFLDAETMDRVRENWGTEKVELLHALRTARCKLIIHNYRLESLPPEFRTFLRRHYVLIDRNILVSGAAITKSPYVGELIWPGPYGLVPKGDCRNIRIDDQPVGASTGTLTLSEGDHRVTYEGNGSLLLIPASAQKWMRDNPVQPRVTWLFLDLYKL